MSERLGFDVGIEGAEETIRTLNTVTSDVTRVTSLVGSADYALTNWQTTAKEFDIGSFIRSLIATITLMQSLVMVTKMATVSQEALNAAQGQAQLTQLANVAGATALPAASSAAAAGSAAAGGLSLTSVLGPIGVILALSLSMYTIVKSIQKQNDEIAEQMHKEAEERAVNRSIYEEAFESVEKRRREKFRSVIP